VEARSCTVAPQTFAFASHRTDLERPAGRPGIRALCSTIETNGIVDGGIAAHADPG
jgi:hypothetical protein